MILVSFLEEQGGNFGKFPCLGKIVEYNKPPTFARKRKMSGGLGFCAQAKKGDIFVFRRKRGDPTRYFCVNNFPKAVIIKKHAVFRVWKYGVGALRDLDVINVGGAEISVQEFEDRDADESYDHGKMAVIS